MVQIDPIGAMQAEVLTSTQGIRGKTGHRTMPLAVNKAEISALSAMSHSQKGCPSLYQGDKMNSLT